MEGVRRSFEILKILHSTQGSSRMEIFQCFDGMKDWHFVKRAINFLASEKLIESFPPNAPFSGATWRLTKKGHQVIDDWEADAVTEEQIK